ncbi:MAG: hypothetical protein WKF77_22910 [Planctomycetaceae bacterium]
MTSKSQNPDDKLLTIAQARAKLAKAVSDLADGIDSGPITFRLKSIKKRGEKYPLKLSPLQRESLLHCTRLRARLKRKIKEADEGTQVIGVTKDELDHLNDEVGQVAMYAGSPHKKRLLDILRKVSELFADDHAGLFDAQ